MMKAFHSSSTGLKEKEYKSKIAYPTEGKLLPLNLRGIKTKIFDFNNNEFLLWGWGKKR